MLWHRDIVAQPDALFDAAPPYLRRGNLLSTKGDWNIVKYPDSLNFGCLAKQTGTSASDSANMPARCHNLTDKNRCRAEI